MTGDRNASLLAAADALMNEHLDEFADDDGYEVGWRDSRYGVTVRDAIYDALASSSASGAERMREAAADLCANAMKCMSCGTVFHGADDVHTDDTCHVSYASWGEATATDIAIAIRALPLPDPVPAWRPIETAPNEDGWIGPALFGAQRPWGWETWVGQCDDGDIWLVRVGNGASVQLDASEEPTHWQPLPPPPQTGGHDA